MIRVLIIQIIVCSYRRLRFIIFIIKNEEQKKTVSIHSHGILVYFDCIAIGGVKTAVTKIVLDQNNRSYRLHIVKKIQFDKRMGI